MFSLNSALDACSVVKSRRFSILFPLFPFSILNIIRKSSIALAAQLSSVVFNLSNWKHIYSFKVIK